MSDFSKKSINVHKKFGGKIGVELKFPIDSEEDLAVVYTPWVAAPCLEIHEHPEKVHSLTIKKNSVAVVSDGTSVLGLGNIGPHAALPVMEGKALLFKKYGNIDAWPICIDATESDEIIETIRRIAPAFGGINLEDISSPRCFEIESKLQDLGIPVFHDDQHGTAAVVLAGLVNSCKVLGKEMESLKVVISGAGAAGIAIVKLLKDLVEDIVLCDSKGVVSQSRCDLNSVKKMALGLTNKQGKEGSLPDALVDADVFIGVSSAGILTSAEISKMAKDPIIFALANPIPEIMPEEAVKGGAAIVATGRSDFPNQVNNVLIFPGIFRGALDVQAKKITSSMIQAAAYSLAGFIEEPTRERILPGVMDPLVAAVVAKAVADVAG